MAKGMRESSTTPGIDLHIHSVYSDDGEFSVPELMERCRAARLEYLSITDHNSVRSVPEALSLGAGMGMRVVSGVELDCMHMGRDFHLLGYGFNPAYPAFGEIERDILEQEQNAAQQKLELIQKATGIPFSPEEVLAAAGDGVVTGELVAEVLLRREDAAEYAALLPYLPGGYREDNPCVNFYWDYFSQGKPAYVPMEYISFRQGVELIHAAGGVAVLAHPGQNLQNDYAFLELLMETGIDGVEAYSSYHGRIEAAYFAMLAEQNSLLVTCGSDFHGKTKPAVFLGGHRADEGSRDAVAALKKAGVFS